MEGVRTGKERVPAQSVRTQRMSTERVPTERVPTELENRKEYQQESVPTFIVRKQERVPTERVDHI